MNEKQFKRLRRLWHQEQVACSRMMYMRQGPALHSSERNMRRVNGHRGIWTSCGHEPNMNLTRE